MSDRQDVAIVSCGVQGIFLACAKRLAAAGSKVAIWDFDKAALENATKAIEGAIAVQVDITDRSAIAAALFQTETTLGPVTRAVTSAGIAGPNAVVEDYPVQDWQQIMDVNLNGSFHLLAALLPGMKARSYGRICLIASVAGDLLL